MSAATTLVTGATSGIGLEIARLLAASGPVIIHGRREEAVAEVLPLLPGSGHGVWVHDLSNLEGVAPSLQELAMARGQDIAAVVHSAGIVDLLPLRVATWARTRALLDINVVAPLEITRTLASKRANGTALRNVVFVSSVSANRGAKAQSAYCASKGAINALMRSLAVELAPVRVNAVLPGTVATRMTRNIFSDPELQREVARRYPLGLGEASAIAPAVEFLLSARAAWITGHELIVDGGFSCH